MPPTDAKPAYFISSHGFGHAARSCAVVDALGRRSPGLEVEIWSAVPPWFFGDSLDHPVLQHDEVTDLGLVQRTALDEDLPETLRRLEDWVPPKASTVQRLVDALHRRGITHVVADISPLGLEVARRGGWPAALIENFTWDWIYSGYLEDAPGFGAFIPKLRDTFAGAALHLQVEPFCRPVDGATACPPVSRSPRLDRPEVRQRLGIPEDASAVLVTMGGIEWDYGDLESRLADLADDVWLIIPGSCREPERHGRVVRLPHRSDFYHPDLMHAVDAVLGKLGYSTLAEVWRAGVPFAYVPRSRFPESPPLEAWVQDNLPHLRVTPERFTEGGWLDDLPRLLERPRNPRRTPEEDGAEVVAEHLLKWMGS